MHFILNIAFYPKYEAFYQKHSILYSKYEAFYQKHSILSEYLNSIK
jgi:hypothetical protein